MSAPPTMAGAGSTGTNSTPTATRSSGARSSSRRQVSRGSDHRYVAYRGTCGRAPRGPWAANLERPPQKEHPASVTMNGHDVLVDDLPWRLSRRDRLARRVGGRQPTRGGFDSDPSPAA